MEPTDFPYGERQYEAEDPAGHRWTFSETLADVDPGDVGRHPRLAGIASSRMTGQTISREVARRYLTLHHFLAPPRSLPAGTGGILAVFDRLGSIQFDPIEIAGRNHDLVLLARVADYRRELTDRLLYEERSLFETYNKGLSLVPTADLPWYRINWDRARIRFETETFAEHAPLVEELLERIRTTGPMSSIDIAPREAIEWSWRPTNQVRAVLEALALAGILGLARRDGNRRVYDLVERLFPAEILEQVEPPRERFRHKLLSRYRAHGLLGQRGSAELWLGTTPPVGRVYGLEGDLAAGAVGRRALHAELVEAGDVDPVTVDGIRGERYLPAEGMPLLAQAERELAAGAPPGERRAWRGIPRRARPARLGSRPAADAVRLRLPLGGLRPRCQASLGLLRPADHLRRPAGRPDRAADRAQDERAAHRRAVVGGRVRPAGRETASSRRLPQPSRLTAHSAASTGSPGRERLAIGRSCRPSGRSGRRNVLGTGRGLDSADRCERESTRTSAAIWLRLATPRTALVLGALGVVLLAAAIPLSALAHQLTIGGLAFHVILLPFGIVGFTVARRVPQEPDRLDPARRRPRDVVHGRRRVLLGACVPARPPGPATRTAGGLSRDRLDLDARPDAAADRAVPRRPSPIAAVALDDVGVRDGRRPFHHRSRL